ncbi:2Fe-2S iron-sulfur cluster-binding protein [Bordetella sp. FB-8]|uniref:2Fe-2S iron-sulfur cluster-binding protein n=1 Tax=Bordetella sp. FB-8 TaxID=1159870 RepID=UPI000374D6AF|nr:2Fe-2S iron-sulfur cluster-binding protein [Bordetella sp. FB-8]
MTDSAGTAYTVALRPSDWRFESRPQATVLLEAQRAGIRLPSSCRNGVCRSCLCRMLQGQVDYVVQWPGLSSDEKADGWILPCVAQARADLLIEAPDAVVLERRESTPFPLTGARRD